MVYTFLHDALEVIYDSFIWASDFEVNRKNVQFCKYILHFPNAKKFRMTAWWRYVGPD